MLVKCWPGRMWGLLKPIKDWFLKSRGENKNVEVRIRMKLIFVSMAVKEVKQTIKSFRNCYFEIPLF